MRPAYAGVLECQKARYQSCTDFLAIIYHLNHLIFNNSTSFCEKKIKSILFNAAVATTKTFWRTLSQISLFNLGSFPVPPNWKSLSDAIFGVNLNHCTKFFLPNYKTKDNQDDDISLINRF